MQADAARVRVVNGTTTPDLPIQVTNYLLAKGMQVFEVGEQAERLYERTTVVVYGPKLYTLEYLVTLFGIDRPNQIVFKLDAESPVDIEVRVGHDAPGILQMISSQ
jgi:hypothetical protein